MTALSGVRTIDLSRLAPGPYCSMLLADMGADVIRVDNPHGGPVRSGDMVSRNKRSIVLDLKTPGGRGVLDRLVDSADVFLEGNRPGVNARLGCDWERLHARNPRLVYCSLRLRPGRTDGPGRRPRHQLHRARRRVVADRRR